MLRDHPWFGVGLDNFLHYYGDYVQPGAEIDRWLSHPHNLLLDFWLRLGLGGLHVVAILILEFVRASRRALLYSRCEPLRGLAVGLTAGMGAALVHGLIDASFFVVELAFWFMLALAWIVQLSRPAQDISSLS
jgi:O-antigen ligase